MSIWPSPRRWFSKPRGEQSKTLHPKPSLFSSLSRDRPAGTRRQNASNRRHRRGGYWRTGGLDVSAGAIGKTFEKRWQGRGMGVVNSGRCRRQHRSCQGRFRVATKGSPLYASCCSYVGLRRIVALVEQRLAAQGTRVHRRSNRRSSARLDAAAPCAPDSDDLDADLVQPQVQLAAPGSPRRVSRTIARLRARWRPRSGG